MRTISEETRRESYDEIILNEPVRQEQILEALSDGVQMTARELAEKLGYTERNYTAPRLTELKHKGLVRVVGKKKDEATGRSVGVYEAI